MSTIKQSEEMVIKTRITRKKFIRSFSLAAAAVITGCSQIKYLTGCYPDKYKNENKTNELSLRAFVTTVIPGADEKDPNLIKIFYDEYYSFKPLCGFFISDLCTKSKDLFDIEEFNLLNEEQRNFIVQEGLNGDSMISRLYTAAIFMTQVSYYSGIYDDGVGCKLIDFEGSNTGFTESELFYPNTTAYLSNELTLNGNYV